MIKLLQIFIGWLLTSLAVVWAAAGGDTFLFGNFSSDLRDQASLQRGAAHYMNYCAGCHSLEFLRFSRMAQDIGITFDDGTVAEPLLAQHLMFVTDRVGEPLHVAMSTAQGQDWFGVGAPDLSLIEKARGGTWLYNYLLSFYADPQRIWGTNNAVFKDVGMPHVLLNLQGEQQAVWGDDNGHGGKELLGFELTSAGELSREEYQEFVYDLVNFMTYASDPGKLQRHRIGLWVLLFLFVFFVFSYLLKREYWKDVKK